jgi:hypothetical protein
MMLFLSLLIVSYGIGLLSLAIRYGLWGIVCQHMMQTQHGYPRDGGYLQCEKCERKEILK